MYLTLSNNIIKLVHVFVLVWTYRLYILLLLLYAWLLLVNCDVKVLVLLDNYINGLRYASSLHGIHVVVGRYVERIYDHMQYVLVMVTYRCSCL